MHKQPAPGSKRERKGMAPKKGFQGPLGAEMPPETRPPRRSPVGPAHNSVTRGVGAEAKALGNARQT